MLLLEASQGFDFAKAAELGIVIAGVLISWGMLKQWRVNTDEKLGEIKKAIEPVAGLVTEVRDVRRSSSRAHERIDRQQEAMRRLDKNLAILEDREERQREVTSPIGVPIIPQQTARPARPSRFERSTPPGTSTKTPEPDDT